MLPFFSLFNMSRVSKTGESPVFFFFKRTADTEDAFMGKYTRLCLVLIEHTHSTEQTQMNIFIDACQLQFFPE